MKKDIIKLIDINQKISGLIKLKALENMKGKKHNTDYLQYAFDNLQNSINWLIKYENKENQENKENK